MGYTIMELETMLARSKAEMRSIEKELQRYPDGRLMSALVNGKPGYFQVLNENGKRLRNLITKDHGMIEKLLRKEYLQFQMNAARREYNEISSALHSLRKNDSPLSSIILRHKWLDKDLLLAAQRGPADLAEWANQPYEQSDRYPAYKIHRTSQGLLVRSKSEVLIAEALYEAGIAFHYEELLHIHDVTFAPDFTIHKANGDIYYWEHQGLMADPKYFEHHFYKLRNYFTAGIVPWKNLILTYDGSDGRIDIREVHSQIEQKLLV